MSLWWSLRVAALTSLCTFGFVDALVAQETTIDVRAGGQLQAAIDAAQPGDTIVLEAGATFTGNFVLPVKPGAGFITIRTASDLRLPADGIRVTPTHAPLLAKIRSGNAAAALRTAPGAHHWRLVLLEFPATYQGYGDILQLGDGSSAQNQPSQVPHTIELDRLYIHGDAVMGQKRGIALNAAGVTIQNCYISDIKAVGVDAQAIGGWNGPGPYVIDNNYLEASGENFLLGGADPAITGLVTEGVTVRRNFLSRPMAWRDPIVPAPAGVSAMSSPGGSLAAGTYSYRVVARRRVGSGVTARSTASAEVSAAAPGGGSNAISISWQPVADAVEYYVYGRSAGGGTQYWKTTANAFTDTGTAGTGGGAPTAIGDRWLVKNLFELKNARHVVVEQNIFENNWAHGQAGYAILFTPRNQDGACTWCVVEDVTFRANVVRNVAGGVNILGYDNLAPSAQTAGIRISQNLFHGISRSLGGSGWFLLIGDGPRDVVIDHNTVDADGTAILYVYGGTAAAPRQVTGFNFSNNALRHNDYGINGTDFAFGTAVLTNFFPGAVFARNWLQGGYPSRYPVDNLFAGTFTAAFVDVAAADYRPVPGGVLAGQAADGTDIGADIGTVMQNVRTVAEGGLSNGLKAPGNLRITPR